MNNLSDLFLLFEISDILNLLLIIVTVSTVRYASKTLLMEYSSQVLISKHRMRFTNKDEIVYTWEVDIENKGRGYVVKGFILLSIKPKHLLSSRTYYLSKPILDIEPDEKDTIRLILKELDVKGMDPLDCDIAIEVYYQDALNHLYVVSPAADETNKHLVRFEKLPKKIRLMTPRYFKYKYKFRKAVKQQNTFVHRYNRIIEDKQKQANLMINKLKK